jgi:RHS repeat-associated protein
VDYVYDGAGERVKHVDYSGATTKTITFTNDILGLVQVLVADDSTDQTRYLFGLDLIYQDDGSETRYLLADGLGSVRTELVSGTVEAVTTYSPYGNLLAHTGSIGTVYGFTGEQADAATNLIYLRARYYSPSLKTFMSRDPWQGTGWRPETLSYYVYVANNPVLHADPSGHHYCDNPAADPLTCQRLIDSDDRDLTSWLIKAINANAAKPEGARTSCQ